MSNPDWQKPNSVILRRLEDVTLVLCGSKVYLYPKKGITASMFRQRYGSYSWNERGSYKDWRKFYIRMLRNKHLTVTKCYELALKYDVLGTSTYSALESLLEGKKVIRRD